jgi:hypothetical protein
LIAIFQIDRVLLILSIAGVIFAAIKQDPFIVWIGLFFVLIGWVPVPDSSIANILHCGRMLEFPSNKIGKTQVLE